MLIPIVVPLKSSCSKKTKVTRKEIKTKVITPKE